MKWTRHSKSCRTGYTEKPRKFPKEGSQKKYVEQKKKKKEREEMADAYVQTNFGWRGALNCTHIHAHRCMWSCC